MFHFNCRKMVQATAILMHEPGRDQNNYYKLLKLLYIAERQSLLDTGHPITGDRLMAMPHGPALSCTCDLMRGEDSRPEWSNYIERLHTYQLRLLAEPGDDLLCDYEIDVLKAVASKYADKTWQQMRTICHTFPEQIKNEPGDSSREIPLSDLGMRKEAQDAASDIARMQTSFARMTGG